MRNNTANEQPAKTWVSDGRVDAFDQIVHRFIGLVYHTCLRELGDRSLAEDAAQAVFLVLAQKTRTMPGDANLAGWLFRTSRLVCRDIAKAERRRTHRERAVMASTSANADREPAERLATTAALNEALAWLRPSERDAVLLRFYDEMSFREVGAALGVSDDTAQKCVSRALEKMRRHLLRQEITLTSATLGAVFTAEAAHSVPSSLAAKALLAGSALPGGELSAALVGTKAFHVSQGVLHAMRLKLIAATSAATLLVACGILLASQVDPKPQILLAQARDHYKDAKAFSMVIVNDESSGLFPGDYTQRLDWHSNGTFTLKVISPGNKTVPDYVSDGRKVIAIYPDGRREIDSPPDWNNEPGWEVSGGFILGWLENTPTSGYVLTGLPDAVLMNWSFGPRTSWHGRNVKEIVMNFKFHGGQTNSVSLFIDPSTSEYVGYEWSGNGTLGYGQYEDQKLTR